MTPKNARGFSFMAMSIGAMWFFYKNRLLFCDPDDICLGPRERDMMTIYVDFHHDLMEPPSWQQFLEHYDSSYDPELFQSLLEEHEVGLICWLAGSWGWREESRLEIKRRLDNLGNRQMRWHDF